VRAFNTQQLQAAGTVFALARGRERGTGTPGVTGEISYGETQRSMVVTGRKKLRLPHLCS
jgi:hypothetical protein